MLKILMLITLGYCIVDLLRTISGNGKAPKTPFAREIHIASLILIAFLNVGIFELLRCYVVPSLKKISMTVSDWKDYPGYYWEYAGALALKFLLFLAVYAVLVSPVFLIRKLPLGWVLLILICDIALFCYIFHLSSIRA